MGTGIRRVARRSMGLTLIASGELSEVALEDERDHRRGERAPRLLIFDDATGEHDRGGFSRDGRGCAEEDSADVDRRRAEPAVTPGRARKGRAVPGVRSWASSPARSPCCRGTGTG